MPGLRQLEKFNSDISGLGNEAERRKQKGETMPTISLPKGISEADDSDDFLFGLPTEDDNFAEKQINDGEDSSDEDYYTEENENIDQFIANLAKQSQEEPQSDETQLDELDSADSASDFSIPGIDAASDFGDFGDFEDFGTPNTPAVEDFNTVDDFGTADSDVATDDANGIEELSDIESLGEIGDIAEEADISTADDALATELPEIGDIAEADISTADDVLATEMPEIGDIAPPEQSSDAIGDSEEMDFSIPQSLEGDNATPFNAEDAAAEMPESFDLPELDLSTEDAVQETPEMPESFDLPELDLGTEEPASNSPEEPASNSTDSTNSTNSTDNALDGFDLPDIEETSAEEPAMDFSLDESPNLSEQDEQMPSFDIDSLVADDSDSVSDTNNDFNFDNLPSDAFDVEPDASSSDENEGFVNTEKEEDFSIAGFTDGNEFAQPEVFITKNNSSNNQAKQQSNELTEQEYETFKENLNYYPLNVRLAIEEMIVKNELTDDIVMNVVRKVIKRVPARQLANHLEKLLDLVLPVPFNYEKRTAAEYEAYRKSFEYKLKNRILPFLAISTATIICCVIIGLLTTKFVVRPVKAQLLYKEGYTLIENGLYPQSEEKFLQAISYHKSKGWYFKFARAYVEEKQYQRARDTYQRLLYDYNHNKEAGLEYTRMELEELANYERAEELVRREVLDYFVNDPDALLLLGDIYLEWATNKDSSKYELARSEYASLIETQGQQPVYLSRMMRYFIRTDNLKEVLSLKEYFYPKIKKKILEPSDLVELSGYMLDKQYGELDPKDEYLRSYIEDVRFLLEQAVIQSPESPEAMYNYGKYFVNTRYDNNAKIILNEALSMFNNSSKQSHSRLLKQIDTHRMLGEISYKEKDYLQAESYFVDGLGIFEDEVIKSDLKSNEKIGKMYEDLANIDYFISGDTDAAINNFLKATENYNDTPSINYKIGYIHYANNDYTKALASFVKTIDETPSDKNALLALGNTLMQRNSVAAATGYYEKLIGALNLERNRANILYPQVNPDDAKLVEQYMKVANNLGVSFVKRSEQSGDSGFIPKAMANFEESIRAFDALTRNQETMIRVGGSNLAAFNQRYLTYPDSTYESAIYTNISPVLENELIPEESVVR